MSQVKVTLLKDHTHGGRDYKAGEEITVTEEERDWLADPNRAIVEKGSGERVESPGADSAKSGDVPGLKAGPGETRTQSPKARP